MLCFSFRCTQQFSKTVAAVEVCNLFRAFYSRVCKACLNHHGFVLSVASGSVIYVYKKLGKNMWSVFIARFDISHLFSACVGPFLSVQTLSPCSAVWVFCRDLNHWNQRNAGFCSVYSGIKQLGCAVHIHKFMGFTVFECLRFCVSACSFFF